MLSIRNLEVAYQDVVHVLHGVSLEVERGAVVALLGPNGAGKTTLARAVSGLLPIHDGSVTGGTIAWGDQSLLGLDSRARSAMGIAQVMEGRRIFTSMTVEENLVAGGFTKSARKHLRDRTEDAYAMFPRLAERRKQRAGYLSGGEQQMLAIARALMSGPELLILDEPTLGLAPSVRDYLRGVIADVNSRGTTVLLVEQNADLALDVSFYTYILEAGRVVHDGASSELREDPDIQEFYLGIHDGGRRKMQDVKRYRRRKRWLS
ncbi:ABC transporter ATP-binding protein [Nocardioides daejeonensis]|uniref:ABC transporter ATP-binding protein n=1 Tax=Nocardioides daejeonensis TaxID=1046556 RepID=UPI000D74EA88|nr:ABC transporter ATP-binding protein [Nocardioides daejeonensis]